MELNSLFNKINQLLKINLPLNHRKLCDIKPAYGEIFKKYIKGYEFWGFSDMDIIWGKLNNFITEEILDNYDVISSRKNFISGHFTLLRNKKMINKLYEKVPNHKNLFKKEKPQFFDEFHFDNYIKQNKKNIKIYWKKNLLNVENNMDSHQDYHLDRWLWKDGHLTNTKTNEEIMYLHFINWKNSIKTNEIKYNGDLNSFFISYNKINAFRHPIYIQYINYIKNLIFGYWTMEKVRVSKYKILSFYKKFLNKVSL